MIFSLPLLRDDFSPKFVALFTVLLFLKSFHWLAEDRVDFMERSPSISLLFHLRVVSLNLLLAALDVQVRQLGVCLGTGFDFFKGPRKTKTSVPNNKCAFFGLEKKSLRRRSVMIL